MPHDPRQSGCPWLPHGHWGHRQSLPTGGSLEQRVAFRPQWSKKSLQFKHSLRSPFLGGTLEPRETGGTVLMDLSISDHRLSNQATPSWFIAPWLPRPRCKARPGHFSPMDRRVDVAVMMGLTLRTRPRPHRTRYFRDLVVTCRTRVIARIPAANEDDGRSLLSRLVFDLAANFGTAHGPRSMMIF